MGRPRHRKSRRGWDDGCIKSSWSIDFTPETLRAGRMMVSPEKKRLLNDIKIS
jgi:hypothetical protein